MKLIIAPGKKLIGGGTAFYPPGARTHMHLPLVKQTLIFSPLPPMGAAADFTHFHNFNNAPATGVLFVSPAGQWGRIHSVCHPGRQNAIVTGGVRD